MGGEICDIKRNKDEFLFALLRKFLYIYGSDKYGGFCSEIIRRTFP
jgi:hypothetical protein